MGFWTQLKLLLWKNYTVRKRQKLRLVVEIVWPLTLFLILMWVRTRGLKDYVQECHFDEKALPSAGFLPFVQTFYCTFSNPCHSTVKSNTHRPLLNSSQIGFLVTQLEEFLRGNIGNVELRNLDLVGHDLSLATDLAAHLADPNRTLEGFFTIKNVFSDYFIPVLESHIQPDVDNELREKIQTLRLSANGLKKIILHSEITSLKQFFCDPIAFNEIFAPTELSDYENRESIRLALCQLSDAEFVSLIADIGSTVDGVGLANELSVLTETNFGRPLAVDAWLRVLKLSSALSAKALDLDEVKKLRLAVGESLSIALQGVASDPAGSVYAQLCGRNLSQLFEALNKQDKLMHFDDLAKRFHLDRWESQSTDDLNSSSTAACKEMLDIFQHDKLIQIIWRQLKPFLVGKILYSPHTPISEKIMSKLNEKFHVVVDALNLANEWLENISPGLQRFFLGSPEILEFLQNVTNPDKVKSDPFLRRIWEFLRPLHSNGTNVDIAQFVANLNAYFHNNVTDRWRRDFEFADSIVITLRKALRCFEVNKVEPIEDEDKAVAEGLRLMAENRLWAIIVFEDLSENASVLPPHVKYKIRMDADRVDSTKRVEDRLPTPGPRRRPFIDLKYLTFGFAYLQDMLESIIIQEQTGFEAPPGIWVQQFPYPCHTSDQFTLAIARTFPMFMTLAWVYTSAMLIKTIVHEKERRLKEVMKAMGLGNAVHWLGWFVTSFSLTMITVALLTIVLKYGKVLERSDPTLILAFLTCYTIATICLSFLISTFFSNANVSAAAGGIFFFILYAPYAFMVIWEEELSDQVKTFTSLLSNVAFGFGCNFFARFEERGTGLHWHNINQSPYVDGTFSMAQVMLMMLMDAAIYMLIACYLENVFPGDYGIPKPWFYFVTKSYWCPYIRLSLNIYAEDNEEMRCRGASREDFEAEPSHLPCGINIRNLRKVYANGKVAVKDLSLNFFEGQITSFLGHNGAGKTTTISILTGIFPATSGTATIYGYDISKDMDLIRRSLGTCPQFNVLFELLTVEEHLWFYGRLKGAESDKQVKHEVQQMIVDIGLPHKKDELSRNLSGGMQRKLSVAIAFVGGSRTVILDEPTAGVDPFARRGIWELLLKYKPGRTIILTTHHMDEADLLGDRIAIISEGRLRCCGSSLFLKGRFGSGYRLTLARSCVSSDRNGGVHGIDAISALVWRHVPTARMMESVGTELVFTLPSESKRGSGFQSLFDALDRRLENLGISTYGISDSTLEEIFLMVANSEDQDSSVVSNNKGNADDGLCFRFHPFKFIANRLNLRKKVPVIEKVPESLGQSTNNQMNDYLDVNGVLTTTLPTRHPSKYVSMSGWRLIRRQIWALHVKRLLHTKRNIKGLFCEIILPALCVCATLAFTMILPPYRLEPELELQPWLYGPPNYVFYSNENPLDPLAVKYEQEIIGDPGFGTRCIKSNPIMNRPCLREFTPPVSKRKWSRKSIMTDTDNIVVQCICDLGSQSCPVGAGGSQPPAVLSVTGDSLLNVTGRNISDWLVKTNDKYYKKRYGGLTLGYESPLAHINVTEWRSIFDRLTSAANMGQPVLERSEYVFGEFERGLRSIPIFGNIKVWFNNRGWAAVVSYINAVNNLVLRSHLPPDRDPRDYGITAINHPLNFTREQAREELVKRSGISLMHSICVIFAMSFVPASFVLYIIEDRVTKSQHLQFITGVRPIIYWISNLIWDNANYLISASLCVLVFLCFDSQAYVSSTNIWGLIFLLVLYGWASIPLMYPVSFYVDVPSTAFVVLASVNLFVGVVTTVSSYILELMDDDDLQEIAEILKKVYLIFPQYCLGRGLLDMATNHLVAISLQQFGVTVRRNPLTWDFLGKNLFSMFIQGIVFFIFTLMLQYKFFTVCSRSMKRLPVNEERSSTATEDSDVAEEKARILSNNYQSTSNGSVLRVVNLTKVYTGWRQRLAPPSECCHDLCQTRCFRSNTSITDEENGLQKQRGYLTAVDRLCFSVNAGECFGLLGVNGAGKTTTFRMLTNDTRITCGEAFVVGHSIKRDMAKARRHIGYCPQFDALDPLLTGNEQLQFYARLRGIPEEAIIEVVNWQVKRMNLTAYADRCTGTYSGGNKRKLSTAIALIGNPAIVFLDEPTTGMDPQARRFLWNCISELIKDGRSVILTSHSLEECEALCTRLAIMVNGQFQCLGSIQHLKSKFSEGYLLMIRVGGLTPIDAEPIKRFIIDSFPTAVLQEEHHNQLTYQLTTSKLSLLFGQMEAAKQTLHIDDYSVCQTTLDQVFINFAKKQTHAITPGVN